MSEVKFTSRKEELLNKLQNAMRVGLKAVGMEAETIAKRYETAVDTGRLRNSITWATKEREGESYSYTDDNKNSFTDTIGSGIEEDEVFIGTNVYYAQFIEEGARGRKPLHFLKNAAQNHADRYKQILEDALKTLS